MVNAQEWLESQEKYNTKEKRAKVRKLYISWESLEVYPSNADKLTYLDITDNNLPEQDLAVFNFGLSINDCGFACYLTKQGYSPQSDLNLGELKKEYYYPKKASSKYVRLDTSDTDLNSNLEHLPDSIEKFYCSSCEKIVEQLEKVKNANKYEEEKESREENLKEIENLKSYNKELEKSFEQIKQKKEEVDNQLGSISEQNEKLQKQLKNTQQELETIKITKKQLEEQNTQLNQSLTQNQNELKVTKENYQQQIIRLEEDKNHLQQQNIQLQNELIILESKLQSSQSQQTSLLELEQQKNNLETQLEKSQAEVLTLQKRQEVAQLEVAKQKLERQLAYLQEDLNNEKQELVNTKQQLEEAKKNTKYSTAKLRKKEKEQENKIEDLKKQLINKEKQIIIIDNDINAVQVEPILGQRIGKGGYGEVYREITNEINILKNLRNRYIIQYYGTYSDEQKLLIIMDYAENGTLTRLTYIHQENIIHRDLKSMNILLTHNNEVKISDFGLSRTKNISSLRSKDEREIAAKCTVPFKDADNIIDNPSERISLEDMLKIIEVNNISLSAESSGYVQIKQGNDSKEKTNEYFIANSTSHEIDIMGNTNIEDTPAEQNQEATTSQIEIPPKGNH
ncbi:9100_t:CDS:10 [Ambispora leptoticha]|uniref:9100_t:CDS:1 n=1 Tax=Ambispora leptoticha TaxID=144679 RepID=A0A9N9BYP8_9GLOM|nr:9100_t:CDS:10 [Ambispora leptoticha]